MAVTWKQILDDEAREMWDRALQRFPDCSPFQSYAWGEYRSSLGWQPFRWVAFDEAGEVVTMMQGSLRRYPLRLGMLWCEGGPVGDLNVCDESMHRLIKQTTGLKRLYCRFRCDRARRIEDALTLTSKGWAMPWAPLTTNYSMWLDLSLDEESLLAACDRNWRRNLRRSQEKNLSVSQWMDVNSDEVHSVYKSMQDLKGLDEQLSLEEIQQLLKNLKQQLVVYRCDDEQGNVVSLLGCVVIGNHACAVFWATSEAGRKLNASYAVFWALLQHCRRIGVKSYDLAGIDPIRNHGVYRFKRDTGASPIEYLGEWDWASRPFLRWVGNWAIARRTHIDRARLALQRPTDDSATELTPLTAMLRMALAALAFLTDSGMN